MPDFTFTIRYVANVAESVAFYQKLLGIPVVEQSPTFAMLPLGKGVVLGLWLETGVQPTPSGKAGASEIAFVETSRSALDTIHASWAQKGAGIAQPPTDMDFGYTFVALDPDGHRLRVLFPNA